MRVEFQFQPENFTVYRNRVYRDLFIISPQYIQVHQKRRNYQNGSFARTRCLDYATNFGSRQLGENEHLSRLFLHNVPKEN